MNKQSPCFIPNSVCKKSKVNKSDSKRENDRNNSDDPSLATVRSKNGEPKWTQSNADKKEPIRALPINDIELSDRE